MYRWHLILRDNLQNLSVSSLVWISGQALISTMSHINIKKNLIIVLCTKHDLKNLSVIVSRETITERKNMTIKLVFLMAYPLFVDTF